MARIRSIKPEFWADYSTASNLSRDARLLYIALWNFCDEHARMAGDVRYVKGQTFPYDDDLTVEGIEDLLVELERDGKVTRYVVDDAPYLFLPKLVKHQRLESKVASRLPEPPDPDKSARRADESAPDSDIHTCGQPSKDASPQVSPTIEDRADLSARDAHSSGEIVVQQVAGSRGQVAGGRRQGTHETPPPLPGEIEILRSKLDGKKMPVRWDDLDANELAEIVALVHLHGDGPLVKAAVRAYRPNDPPVFAQAWLGDWRALRAPGDLALVVELCPEHRFQREPAGSCRFCAADALAGDA